MTTSGKPAPQAYATVCQEEDGQVDKIDFLSDQLALVCAEVAALQKTALAATEDPDQDNENATLPEQEMSPVHSSARSGGAGFGGESAADNDNRSNRSINSNRGPSPLSGSGPSAAQPSTLRRTPTESSHAGSISTTSTLDSTLGLYASSPRHVTAAASAAPTKKTGFFGIKSPSFSSQKGSDAGQDTTRRVEKGDIPPPEADEERSQQRSQQGSTLSAGAVAALSKQSSAATLKVATAGIEASRCATLNAAKAGLGASMKVATFITDIKDNLASNLASATGFVTFKTRRAQVSASQVPVISQQYPKVTATAAPAPSDIIWENMSASPEHTENVAYVSATFYYTGDLFLWSFYIVFFVNYLVSGFSSNGLTR